MHMPGADQCCQNNSSRNLGPAGATLQCCLGNSSCTTLATTQHRTCYYTDSHTDNRCESQAVPTQLQCNHGGNHCWVLACATHWDAPPSVTTQQLANHIWYRKISTLASSVTNLISIGIRVTLALLRLPRRRHL